LAESIPELLNRSLRAMPAQPAAEFLGTVLSRSELADQSDRLASWLTANGAGSGSLVGIYMDRSIEMLVSVLAVIKAGGAYVPLDPQLPRTRIEQILGETQVPVLLTLTRRQQDLEGLSARVFPVDGEAELLRAQPIARMPDVHPDTRAYVMFTSGSTGVPKGVEVRHGSVVNLLQSAEKLLEVGPGDRLFAITTLAFDISVLELWLPLVTGGTVIIASQEVAAQGDLLAEQLLSTRATILQATPFTFRTLLNAGFKPPVGFKMLCGGEAWTMAMAEKLLASGSRLWNMYGPTETTVWSSIIEVKAGEPKLTIGPPIANTRFYIVADENLKPVPSGESGELLIGGAGVALGYFHREQLTAEKFLPEFNVQGERMFRTGDQVRQLADGRIEFIGRLDQQIKLRGYRIELGEIETAMVACEGIRDAVATLREEASGEAFLVCFYTGRESVPRSVLRESLSQRLPKYMVPRYFERLEALPLTPNGKKDRRVLAGYLLKMKSLDMASEAGPESGSGSQTEQQMLGIWQKLFAGSPIATDSDFFDLGGDSLLMLQLQSMIDRKFGLRLNAIDITTQPTVRQLSKWAEKRLADDEPDKTPYPDPRLLPLQPAGNGPPIFILPQMMIFRTLAEQLGSEQPVYAMQIMDDDVPKEMDSANMEMLAHLYVRLIQRVQPKGPYRLGGWCLWGWVAYEVARLLEEQGEVVEILVIIDALAPGFWERYSRPRRLLMSGTIFLYRAGWFLRRLWRTSLARRQKAHRTLALSITSALPRRWRPEFYATETTRLEQITSSAAISYRPPAIKARMLVFKSEVRPAGASMGEDMGWNAVMGHPVQINTLPGNHLEIMHPTAARMMAARVREALGLGPAAVSTT
jgi:amino acid adenylation domain-containing protein